MKTTILMLGGSRRVSLAELFKESGKRFGIDVEIVAYELTREVPIALAGKVVEGLKWSDPDVVEDIARVVKENNVDIILPFVNGAVEIASLCKEKMPEVFVPVADFSVTSRIFDKVEAAKVFKDNEFPIPRTYSIINNEMPAIAKPRKGGSSRGIKIFHDVEDLMHLENLDSYIIQEYIENAREFTIDCYVDQSGRIICTVPRERLEVMGGEVNRTRTCHSKRLIEMSREVIGKMKLTGCVTLQFLHDPAKDRYLLMELNPRLGGGVICSIFAGAHIEDYILLESMGKEPEVCDDWKANVLMARYMKETIFFE